MAKSDTSDVGVVPTSVGEEWKYITLSDAEITSRLTHLEEDIQEHKNHT
jgi:hypothetical protein